MALGEVHGAVQNLGYDSRQNVVKHFNFDGQLQNF